MDAGGDVAKGQKGVEYPGIHRGIDAVCDRGTDRRRPWPCGFGSRHSDLGSPLVARRKNTCGVSPALDTPGCVENARCRPRLRLRFSPCQMAPMKSPIPIRARSSSSIRRTLPAPGGGVGDRVPRAQQAKLLTARLLSSRAITRTPSRTLGLPSTILPLFSRHTNPEANWSHIGSPQTYPARNGPLDRRCLQPSLRTMRSVVE